MPQDSRAMASRLNASGRPILVHLTCTKQDGTAVIHRSWADVTIVESRNEGITRLDVELVQDAIFGYAFGQETTQEWERIYAQQEERAEDRQRAQRERERDGWRRRVDDARTLVEEWGLPALRLQRVAGEARPQTRRRRREEDDEEAEGPRQRRRVDTSDDDGGAGPSFAG